MHGVVDLLVDCMLVLWVFKSQHMCSKVHSAFNLFEVGKMNTSITGDKGTWEHVYAIGLEWFPPLAF